MEFWFVFIGVLAFIALFCSARCLFVRLIGLGKIKRICKTKGYKLHPAHKLWAFGSKQSSKCDFYIETDNEVLAVKLFGMPRKRSVLIVNENGEYVIRSYIVVFSYSPGCRTPFDSKPKRIPAYDFRYKYKEGWEHKNLQRVVLVTPEPIELIHRRENGGDVLVGSSMGVRGIEYYCSSCFIKYLENL